MLRPVAVVLSSMVVSVSFAQTDAVKEIRKDAAAEAKAVRESAREAAKETREALREAAQQGNPAPHAGQTHREARFDSHVANCLILGNRQEIALLKYGRDKVSNDELKSLIDKMLKEHEQAVTDLTRHGSFSKHQLESFTVNVNPARLTSGSVVQIQREARKIPAEELNQEFTNDRMHRLAWKTSQETISLTEAELNKFKGHEFDQAFIGSQIACHLNMLAHLKAAESEASEPLAKLLQQQEKAVTQDKEQLEALMKTAGHGDKKSDRDSN